MSAIYHILDKIPGIYKEEIQIEYETLAQKLVKSGKVRIDTDICSNFARFTDPRINASLMVSKEELTDQVLLPSTQKIFYNLYKNTIAPEKLDHKIISIFKDLKQQINKLLPVSPELMIRLARVFVQSAHPIVIWWLLYDKTEVFISYSHNIGGMMDMISWKHSGNNSGMQSTDGRNVAIFVSCGGDPFAVNNKDYPAHGDGWAAVARMQIIAAQELGHFADIKRDTSGRQITRHSADFSGTRAHDHVKIARKADIKNCNNLLHKLNQGGLIKLSQYETKLRFYEKNKIRGLKVLYLILLKFIYKHRLLIFAHNHQLLFIKRFTSDKYMALMIIAMIRDMQFNLSPVADVYKRADKEAEEAIACIEALARVPQQVQKWGYLTTSMTMQGLYKVYYQEVIPSLIQNYEAMTGKIYQRNYSYPKKNILYLLKQLINIFKKTNKIKLKQVREITAINS